MTHTLRWMPHGMFAIAFAALSLGTPLARAGGESVVARTSDIVAVEDHGGDLRPRMHPWFAICLLRSQKN